MNIVGFFPNYSTFAQTTPCTYHTAFSSSILAPASLDFPVQRPIVRKQCQ